VETNSPVERLAEAPNFTTTRWSLILSCSASEAAEVKAQQALTELCRTYWRPVFAFVCRRGYSVPDAQDLTQSFFVMLLNGNFLKLADPHRGRFRSLLCTAVKNFLADQRDKAMREKRGGRIQFVAWDDWMSEAPSQLSLSTRDLATWTAERIFDFRWAATVVEESLRRLSEECARRGRLRVFTLLNDYLIVDRSDVSYASLSISLGVPETAIKRLLHDLRARFRTILREEVSQTVNNPADLEDEIRYLCAALASDR
jgi:DNA-directed RNA polymerase specialized sigma24 family protein